MSTATAERSIRRNKSLSGCRRFCSAFFFDAFPPRRSQRHSLWTWKVLLGVALFLLAVLSITWTFMATEKRGAGPLPSSSELQSKHTP